MLCIWIQNRLSCHEWTRGWIPGCAEDMELTAWPQCAALLGPSVIMAKHFLVCIGVCLPDMIIGMAGWRKHRHSFRHSFIDTTCGGQPGADNRCCYAYVRCADANIVHVWVVAAQQHTDSPEQEESFIPCRPSSQANTPAGSCQVP